MTEFQPLSALMASRCSDDLLVAMSHGREKKFGEFRSSVTATIEKIQSRKVDKVVLATEDAYKYCVGFLAALHSSCRIIVPPNSQPGTLGNYVSHDCPLLSEGRGVPEAEWIEIGGEARSEFEFLRIDPARSHLDFYTSGSTGTPKCIPKLLSQIEDELTVLQSTWGAELIDSITLGTVTHQHIYGLYFKALWPLSAGRPFYGQTFEIWEDMLAQAPNRSCFVSSPAHLSRIPAFTPLSEGDQPQMILSAGGPLSYSSAQHAQEIFGVLPTEIYGSTETGGVAHRQQAENPTPFKPLSGMETRIAASGILSVRSNYTDNQDWAETNDLATRFEDGQFLLTGRSDQFTKIEGKRVSLAEVEKYLCQSELVTEAAVILLEGEREGLAAIVELSNTGKAKLTDMGAFRLNRQLRQFLQDTLEPAAMPKRWRFVEALPTNSQGKRMRSALQELFK
ncbi:MAG: AMP-binding protein [Proteobacteria bacterium]|nr:AMP-binding protein [Pseudomonadota bacterium]